MRFWLSTTFALLRVADDVVRHGDSDSGFKLCFGVDRVKYAFLAVNDLLEIQLTERS